MSFDLQMTGGFPEPSVETLEAVVNGMNEFQVLEGVISGHEDTIRALSEDADIDADERLYIYTNARQKAEQRHAELSGQQRRTVEARRTELRQKLFGVPRVWSGDGVAAADHRPPATRTVFIVSPGSPTSSRSRRSNWRNSPAMTRRCGP